MIFKATDVIDYWAQAHLKSRITSIARMLSLAITSSYKLYVVFSKGTILQYAFSALIDTGIVGTILFYTYFSTRTDQTKWKFNIAYVLNILRKCWYIVISGLMITVYVRIDQIMLGSMISNKAAVGIYTAALNIAQMWYFVPSAIVASFQSIIMEYHANDNMEKYNYHMRGLYTIIIYISFGFALVVSLLSPILIAVIYGSAYAEASSILAISIWGGIFAMLGVARDTWLICEGLQKYTLIYSLAGSLTNVVLNLFLIPAYGAYGAAVATVIAQFNNIVILLFFKKGRKTVFMMFASLSPRYLFENFRRLIPLKESG
jgi:O-antigen/teichoic acid export membrane protein